MSNSVENINKLFLKSKGLELKPSTSCYLPYEAVNEKYLVQLSEFGDLHIMRIIKETPDGSNAKEISVINIFTELLTEEDFNYTEIYFEYGYKKDWDENGMKMIPCSLTPEEIAKTGLVMSNMDMNCKPIIKQEDE